MIPLQLDRPEPGAGGPASVRSAGVQFEGARTPVAVRAVARGPAAAPPRRRPAGGDPGGRGRGGGR